MSIVAVGQLAAGCVAATKVEPPVLSYLIVWMLPARRLLLAQPGDDRVRHLGHGAAGGPVLAGRA